MRVVTETVDEQGQAATSSVARTRTTLEDVTSSGVTLKVESTVEVAGKEVETDPQILAHGWHGEAPEAEAIVTELGDDVVSIGDDQVACRLEQVEQSVSGGRTVTKTWYSEDVCPYVLRRESVTFGGEGTDAVSETQMAVAVLSKPRRVLRRDRKVAEMVVVYKHAAGTTKTRVWSCSEVPGGVVGHESEEFNADGRLTRRSRLELLDYDVM